MPSYARMIWPISKMGQIMAVFSKDKHMNYFLIALKSPLLGYDRFRFIFLFFIMIKIRLVRLVWLGKLS